MKYLIPRFLFCFLILYSATNQVYSKSAYSTDTRLTRRIGRELWNVMNPAERRLFPSPECVVVAEDLEPWVKPVQIRYSTVAGRYIAVSTGFIDLMNNISHAKAIEKIEPGYFQEVVDQLAAESGDFPLKDIPRSFEKKYWSSEIINEQESNFNQMVAMLIAMQISHHGLHHFDKFRDELEDPLYARQISELLNPREWNDAFQAGLALALKAGYGVEGFEALCEAMDNMPNRPAWTTYFLPRRIDVSKLENELERSEKQFFKLLGE